MARLEEAREFLYREARVLERRRFERLFGGGDAAPVLAALDAYRNDDDGGYGHAIEPDIRSPSSQPVGVQTAMEVLHEAGETAANPRVGPACDFLGSIQREDGGVPFALASAADAPRAPWWRFTDASSITQSMANAAALHTLGAEHPALDRLTEFCWARVEDLDFTAVEIGPGAGYDARFTVAFLNAAPDAERAEIGLERIVADIRGAGLVRASGEESELPGVLDLAPLPTDHSRWFFDAGAIEAELDTLAADQADDGGWTFTWPQWNPAAAHEWRGVVTVEALKTLSANGRM